MTGATTKHAYNLPAATIDEVRRMALSLHLSEDSVVERSIRAYSRSHRDSEHAQRWAAAATDSAFQAEMKALAAGFAADDRSAWDR